MINQGKDDFTGDMNNTNENIEKDLKYVRYTYIKYVVVFLFLLTIMVLINNTINPNKNIKQQSPSIKGIMVSIQNDYPYKWELEKDKISIEKLYLSKHWSNVEEMSFANDMYIMSKGIYNIITTNSNPTTSTNTSDQIQNMIQEVLTDVKQMFLDKIYNEAFLKENKNFKESPIDAETITKLQYLIDSDKKLKTSEEDTTLQKFEDAYKDKIIDFTKEVIEQKINNYNSQGTLTLNNENKLKTLQELQQTLQAHTDPTGTQG